MVLKRKMAPRRRMGMRKRRRIARFSRVSRSLRVNQVALKRTFFLTNWAFGTAATSDFWRYYTFNLANMQGIAEVTGLFDEYKINGIKITVRPQYDSVTADAAVGGGPQAYMHYCIDGAGTQVPAGVYNSATLNSFLEQANVKTRTLNRPFNIYFKPKILEDAGAAQPVLPRWPSWIITTQNAINHRGVYMFLQQNNLQQTNTNIKLDLFVTYYLQLRNMR